MNKLEEVQSWRGKVVDADGQLSPDQERQLWEHYGRSDYDEWQGEDRTTAPDMPDDRRDAERQA